MRVVSLASGSGGNAYAVVSGGAALLVDCGISCRELVKRCCAAGIDPVSICAVAFTHNHNDHVKGAATFHSRFPGATFYANLMTAEAVALAASVGYVNAGTVEFIVDAQTGVQTALPLEPFANVDLGGGNGT